MLRRSDRIIRDRTPFNGMAEHAMHESMNVVDRPWRQAGILGLRALQPAMKVSNVRGLCYGQKLIHRRALAICRCTTHPMGQCLPCNGARN